MLKQPFKLLSQSKKVVFNGLTTEQGKDLYSQSRRYQETWNTKFLNEIQDPEHFFDANEWTREERHYAMLVIYMELFKGNFDKIQETFKLLKCRFCQKEHDIVVDYSELFNPKRKHGGITKLGKLPTFKTDSGKKYTVYPLLGKHLIELEKIHNQYPVGFFDSPDSEKFKSFTESDKYAELQEQENCLLILAHLRKEESDFTDYFEFKSLWAHIEPLLPKLEHGLNWCMQYTCVEKKRELREQYPEGAVNAMITKQTKGHEDFFNSDEFKILKEAEESLEVTLPVRFRDLRKLQAMGA